MFERWDLWKTKVVCIIIQLLKVAGGGEGIKCVYTLQPNQKPVEVGGKR